MKTTFNEDLELAKSGKWDEAWKVAQQDEDLNPGVTKEQWIAFAKNVILQREEHEKQVMPEAYYS